MLYGRIRTVFFLLGSDGRSNLHDNLECVMKNTAFLQCLYMSNKENEIKTRNADLSISLSSLVAHRIRLAKSTRSIRLSLHLELQAPIFLFTE